ncbi:MAG TPA: fatty acid--CoA ligase family protein [Nocardia sp.]|nr:fatty acid--CoA ligase family protein [Nocardia sp.]HLS77444.1 fatty acid--CoA ligase family protein [Nocardia sp.]
MTGISEALDRLWTAAQDAPMVQFEGEWVFWGRVKVLAEKVDAALAEAGCGERGRTAVVLGNRPESVAALLALLRGGRALVTLNPLQPSARMLADLEATGAGYVLATPDYWADEKFVAAVRRLDAHGWEIDLDAGLTQRQRGDGSASPAAAGVAVELPTSGTTGPPKRIPLSRRQLEASLAAALQHTASARADPPPALTGRVALVTLPIVHIGGLWSLLQALVQARPLVLLRRFTVDGWRRAVREHRPAIAGLPGAAIRSVLDADVPAAELSSLRAVNAGTSPIDPALVDAFHERYGIPLLIVYGATEFSGAVAGWSLEDFREHWTERRGSVGRAFPGVRLDVVDEHGGSVPAGVTGRLRVRTPQAAGDGDGGWVTTSDLAHLDEDGFLYIDGRADDVIIRGGFKISPATVVRALQSHDSVAEAAVAGLPHERLGQVPVAAVELRTAARVPDTEELVRHCRERLTPYEVPVAVRILDELPRGAALKVDRRRLLEILEDLEMLEGTDTHA